MAFTRFTLAAVAALVVAHAPATAKNKIGQKTLYAFGVAMSFNDSTIYLTDIHSVDSMWLNGYNNALLNRDNYSYELRNHLNDKGLLHYTCAILYAEKRKDIDKKYQRVKDKSLKRGNCYISYIHEDEFRFKPIDLDDYEREALEKKAKDEKKEKKEKRSGRPGGQGGQGGPGGPGGPGGGPGGGGPGGGMPPR